VRRRLHYGAKVTLLNKLDGSSVQRATTPLYGCIRCKGINACKAAAEWKWSAPGTLCSLVREVPVRAPPTPQACLQESTSTIGQRTDLLYEMPFIYQAVVAARAFLGHLCSSGEYSTTRSVLASDVCDALQRVMIPGGVEDGAGSWSRVIAELMLAIAPASASTMDRHTCAHSTSSHIMPTDRCE
jgi:hypothetical protein